MRAFACPVCKSLVFFPDDRCLTCDSELAFDRERADLVALRDAELPRCANHGIASCNWLAEPDGRLCHSCELTRTRPNDDDAAGLAAFAAAETAKRALVYQLDHLGLPTTTRSADPEMGLAFDLLSSEQQPVTTGHADGVITIDLAEGADPHREALRIQLAEPYRTMLGHLRHEIGHWYWYVLVEGLGPSDDGDHLTRFRELFGDEREDYADALQKHYGSTDPGPQGDWVETHISHYAAAHPWEDWAECFAHYLHMRDTLETAGAWGVRVDGPDLDLSLAWDAQLDVVPVEDPGDFDELARSWLALTTALNQLNRSMGHGDLYPFRLRPAVLEKLRFVHVLITSYRSD